MLELLKARPELTSIKSELIPFLLAHQFSSEPVLNPGQPLLDAVCPCTIYLKLETPDHPEFSLKLEI